MKLAPATKIDNRNKIASKIFDDEAVSINCDFIVIFPIYGQFRAIQKPNGRHIVGKIYILINSNLLSHKN